MVRALTLKLKKCFSPFTMMPVEGPLKQDFLDIYLKTCFGLPNFGNIQAMGVTFFSKCSKFNVASKNASKK